MRERDRGGGGGEIVNEYISMFDDNRALSLYCYLFTTQLMTMADIPIINSLI